MLKLKSIIVHNSLFSDYRILVVMLANLLRQPGLSRLVKRPLNLKLEVRNCQVNFQNYLHLSASGRGDLKDLVEKPVKPKQPSKFPGFDPVFLSPHIGTIRFFTRLVQ